MCSPPGGFIGVDVFFVLRDDARMHDVLGGLMESRRISRFIDGGLVDNVRRRPGGRCTRGTFRPAMRSSWRSMGSAQDSRRRSIARCAPQSRALVEERLRRRPPRSVPSPGFLLDSLEMVCLGLHVKHHLPKSGDAHRGVELHSFQALVNEGRVRPAR